MIPIAKTAIVYAAILGLLACSRPVATPTVSPLLYVDAEVDRADNIAVFIPGAFSSIDIFDAAKNWSTHGYALAYYRFPGMDGLPIKPDLSIDNAVAAIANFAFENPEKPLVLVGYSTGGPIALLAAESVQDGRPVSVATISSAVEHGGGLSTLVRGVRGITSAALDAKSLRRDHYWKRYWQSLLFGPNALDDPRFDAVISDLTHQYGQNITIPDTSMARAHTGDLSRWTVKRPLDLDHAKVGFFIGLNDPVFSPRQTVKFRNKIGTGEVFGYRDDGHLLVLTQKDLFETIFNFVDN